MSTPDIEAAIAALGKEGLTAAQKEKLEQNLQERLKRLKAAVAGIEKAIDKLKKSKK